MQDAFDYFLMTIDLTDQDKFWAVNKFALKEYIQVMEEEEKSFEAFLLTPYAKEREKYKSTLKCIIEGQHESIDMLRRSIADIQRGLNPDVYYSFRESCIEGQQGVALDKEPLEDKTLQMTTEIALFLLLEQTIITYAEKGLSAIERSDRKEPRRARNFFQSINLSNKDIKDLHRHWLIDGYIEDISMDDFIYYLHYGLASEPSIKIRWKKSVKELAIFLKEVSYGNTPEWSIAEKVFYGMSRTVLKSTMHRLMHFYTDPPSETLDEDILYIRNWLQEKIY